MDSESTVLVIKADASRAKEDLDKVEKAVNRIKEAAAQPSAGDGSGSGSSGGSGSGRVGAAPSQASSPQKKTDSESRADSRETAKNAGMEIGKFFVSYLLQNVASTAFSLAKDPITSNARVERAQSTFSSGLTGATAGAMTGAKVGGPWGGLIGGILGGLAGSGLGWASGSHQMASANMLGRYSRQLAYRTAVQAEADQGSDEAFALRLNQMTRRDKMAAIRKRISEIESGSGSFSVKNLVEAMRKHESLEESSTDSMEYKELAARHTSQLQRVLGLKGQLRALERTPLAALVSGGDYADSYGARGLQLGTTVDVSQTDRALLSELKGINARLDKMAANSDREIRPTNIGVGY